MTKVPLLVSNFALNVPGALSVNVEGFLSFALDTLRLLPCANMAIGTAVITMAAIAHFISFSVGVSPTLLALDLDRHRDRLDRLVARLGSLGVADLLDDIHPFGDFTEDRVLARQVVLRRERDEELAAVGVGAAVRHRQDAGFVDLLAGSEFVGKAITRPAGSVAQWIAALNHEAGDHAMERQTVVVRLLHLLVGFRIGPFLGALGEGDEVRDRLRRVLLEEADREVAFTGREVGVRRFLRRVLA